MSACRALGPGSLRKRGPVWVLDFTEASGRRRRRVLGPDRRVAERRRAELIRQRDLALDGLQGVAGMDMPLAALVDDYLSELRDRATPRHHHNVHLRLERVLAELGDLRVRDLTVPQVTRLRSQVLAAGRSRRTANLLGDNLKAVLAWGVQAGIIATNPLHGLRRLPESGEHQVYRRRALSDDEIRRFLKAAEADDADNARAVPQTPMWRFLLGTGVRYGEMRQLRWGDVDLGRALFVVRAESAKSRKQRTIPLSGDLVADMKRLRVAHEAVHGRLPNVDDHVFLSPDGCPYRRPSTNINRTLRRVLELAGIARIDTQGQRIDVHALRHSFASRLARAGVGLTLAQRLLGHSTPTLTAQVYVHHDVEDLRGAVDALGTDQNTARRNGLRREREATVTKRKVR